MVDQMNLNMEERQRAHLKQREMQGELFNQSLICCSMGLPKELEQGCGGVGPPTLWGETPS